MADSRGFTRSPSGIAWAHNNRPDVVCLAGPQVAAVSLPSGWVETIGFCCGPDRSRNGSGASASVILLKADGGEVVSHPSGWTDGNRMPRGWPLDPDTSVRVEIRSTKDSTHRHVDESDEASRVSSFLSLTACEQWCSMAHASVETSDACRDQRER